MYKFMARRVHDGKLTWDEVKGFKQAAQDEIKKAYRELYPDEDIPELSKIAFCWIRLIFRQLSLSIFMSISMM